VRRKELRGELAIGEGNLAAARVDAAASIEYYTHVSYHDPRPARVGMVSADAAVIAWW